jgi:hypothetical protein
MKPRLAVQMGSVSTCPDYRLGFFFQKSDLGSQFFHLLSKLFDHKFAGLIFCLSQYQFFGSLAMATRHHGFLLLLSASENAKPIPIIAAVVAITMNIRNPSLTGSS